MPIASADRQFRWTVWTVWTMWTLWMSSVRSTDIRRFDTNSDPLMNVEIFSAATGALFCLFRQEGPCSVCVGGILCRQMHERDQFLILLLCTNFGSSSALDHVR